MVGNSNVTLNTCEKAFSTTPSHVTGELTVRAIKTIQSSINNIMHYSIFVALIGLVGAAVAAPHPEAEPGKSIK